MPLSLSVINRNSVLRPSTWFQNYLKVSRSRISSVLFFGRRITFMSLSELKSAFTTCSLIIRDRKKSGPNFCLPHEKFKKLRWIDQFYLGEQVHYNSGVGNGV